MVEFLEWKLEDWLAKQDVQLMTASSSIQLGLQGYVHKQAAIHHNLVVLFVKLWYPILVSYYLEDTWITNYLKKHKISLPNINNPLPQAQGIFKARVLSEMDEGSALVSTTPLVQLQGPSDPTTGNTILLEEAKDIEDNNESEDDYSEA